MESGKFGFIWYVQHIKDIFLISNKYATIISVDLGF